LFQYSSHDVAALELNIPPDLAGIWYVGGPTDIVLGFPHVLPGTLGAFPVLRAGRVASRVHGP
jgi:hypothetical protein